MCEIATILTLASTVIGAVGAIQQGQAASAAAEYQAQVGEMNAILAERRARDADERGKLEEQKKRQEVARIKGQQRAAMGANGVDLTFGSPLDTLVDTAVLGELDALTIRTNTAREAYEHRVDAVNKRAGAELSRMKGESAKTAGYLSAAGTVLTGAGKSYGDYRKSSIGAIG